MAKYSFQNAQDLIDLSEKNNLSVSEVIIQNAIEEEEKTRETLIDGMRRRYQVMRAAVKSGLKIQERTPSGLSGGDAKLLDEVKKENMMLGEIVFTAVKYAFAIQEHNAKFGKVVAFPTAGSSGTVPATLISVAENCNFTDEEIINALFTAGGIGMIAGENAMLAGATGGCQAEVGVACAMAAGALTELRGGNARQVFDAAAIALKGLLGLVCDPLGGLVECPCVKRNATAVSNAFMASDIVIAGVKSNVNFDEVLFAMKNIGERMSSDFKETSRGGLAITPTGCMVNHKLGLSGSFKCGKCKMCVV